MKNFKLVTILAVCTLVSACGYSKTDRALSGGAIGAGVGAAGTALAGGSPWAGAAIGGAAGAITGAVTDPNKVNLDR